MYKKQLEVSNTNITSGVIELPYKTLAPYISDETLFLHYEKHHKGYYKKLMELLSDEEKKRPNLLLDIINNSDNEDLLNNAKQVWNHNFFWLSLIERGENNGYKEFYKKNDLMKKIQGFKEKIVNSAMRGFGSGWVWLTMRDDDTMQTIFTSNADLPSKEHFPLFVIDLWEHAYYMDFQNKKVNFLEDCLNNIINYKFIMDRFDRV